MDINIFSLLTSNNFRLLLFDGFSREVSKGRFSRSIYRQFLRKMALRRSLFNMAERADVAPALKKLWKKHYKVDGQVTQHLSPFEQNIVGPLLKNFIPNAIKRVQKFVIQAGPGLSVGAIAYYWCEWKYKDLAYHHRA